MRDVWLWLKSLVFVIMICQNYSLLNCRQPQACSLPSHVCQEGWYCELIDYHLNADYACDSFQHFPSRREGCSRILQSIHHLLFVYASISMPFFRATTSARSSSGGLGRGGDDGSWGSFKLAWFRADAPRPCVPLWKEQLRWPAGTPARVISCHWRSTNYLSFKLITVMAWNWTLTA